MFDVPQIRLYTASTSFYETSRTPPVYDTAGLTNIGSIVPQSKAATETKQDLTQATEVKRGSTPTTQLSLSGSDPQIKTTTFETRRGATPTAEMNIVKTPTPEIKQATPTSEIKRATPTSENRRATPTAEIKRATPTSEIRVKTPTYEFPSRISAGRPRTPAYHTARAATPVFEVSRPNPLLFAVSPITVEPERSRTPKTVLAASTSSASLSVTTSEPKPTETLPNGHILSDMKPAAKAVQQSITKAKSETDLTREKIPSSPAGSQRLSQTPTPQPTTPAATSYGYQRPKTPTFEASRLMTTSPGYKRPKTPTYGTSPSGASPVAFQRPKTPTQVAQKSKSSYRGLTPAEYAAYGGIKTFTPAFGIASSAKSTEEEVGATQEDSAGSKTPSQEVPVNAQSTAEVSKVIGKPSVEEKVAVTPSVPVIIVSQASDSPGAQDTIMVSSQVVAKHEKMLIQETPKAKPPTVEVKTPEKKKVVQEVAKAQPKTPEAKHPPAKGGDQDPLKAVIKLLGKDKAQSSELKSETGTKADKKEPAKPVAVTKAKEEVSKPSTAAPALHGSEDKGEDKKAESATVGKSTPEKRDGEEPLLASEPLLKVIQKPKGVKSKLSGWSRLKKHMVVEQEEPKFPEIGSQKEASVQDQSEGKKIDEKPVEKPVDKPDTQDENEAKDSPKATKMWEAVLFQMFSTKENIMHQIELNKSEEEKQEEKMDEQKEIPTFAHRLPVLLFSPRFDAKRLKEAASRPVTKISTVFEMGLIGRKGKEEEPKDFNRTARGFTGS
ncbi:neurofilament heavy polypeptide [Labrus bergylta]